LKELTLEKEALDSTSGSFSEGSKMSYRTWKSITDGM